MTNSRLKQGDDIFLYLAPESIYGQAASTAYHFCHYPVRQDMRLERHYQSLNLLGQPVLNRSVPLRHMVSGYMRFHPVLDSLFDNLLSSALRTSRQKDKWRFGSTPKSLSLLRRLSDDTAPTLFTGLLAHRLNLTFEAGQLPLMEVHYLGKSVAAKIPPTLLKTLPTTPPTAPPSLSHISSFALQIGKAVLSLPVRFTLQISQPGLRPTYILGEDSPHVLSGGRIKIMLRVTILVRRDILSAFHQSATIAQCTGRLDFGDAALEIQAMGAHLTAFHYSPHHDDSLVFAHLELDVFDDTPAHSDDSDFSLTYHAKGGKDAQ